MAQCSYAIRQQLVQPFHNASTGDACASACKAPQRVPAAAPAAAHWTAARSSSSNSLHTSRMRAPQMPARPPGRSNTPYSWARRCATRTCGAAGGDRGVPGEMAAAAQCRVSHQSYGCGRYTRGSSCSVTTRAGSWLAAQHHCLRHSYCQHPAEQRCLTALSSSTPQAASAQIRPPALAPTAK